MSGNVPLHRLPCPSRRSAPRSCGRRASRTRRTTRRLSAPCAPSSRKSPVGPRSLRSHVAGWGGAERGWAVLRERARGNVGLGGEGVCVWVQGGGVGWGAGGGLGGGGAGACRAPRGPAREACAFIGSPAVHAADASRGLGAPLRTCVHVVLELDHVVDARGVPYAQ